MKNKIFIEKNFICKGFSENKTQNEKGDVEDGNE
jgi:hypothetical protein